MYIVFGVFRKKWKLGVFFFSFPRGRGPARVFPPMFSEFVVATPHYDSRCAFFRPPDFRPKLYPQDGVIWVGPLLIGILKTL